MRKVFCGKFRVVILLIAILALTISGCSIDSIFSTPKDYSVIDTTLVIHQTNTQNANRYQNNANVEMIVVDDTVYYYIKLWPGSLGMRRKFDGKICTIENGEIYDHIAISTLYGKDEQFIYCLCEDWLVAYDTQSDKTKKLVQLTEMGVHTALVDANGILNGVVDAKTKEHYVIKAGEIVATTKASSPLKAYEIGEKEYSIQKEHVFCQNSDISEQFGDASFRALVPYRNDLLLINDGYGNLLYLIKEDGTIDSLFPEFPCMCSTSSMNFYENYIFVSFKRWEGYAQSGLGMKSYDNDDVEGTYRIDMENNSVKKISDSIYSGMYIFDNAHIYACTRQGDIYQLDFDGNVLQTIVD